MPELPEVELQAEQLRAALRGRPLRAVERVDPALCPAPAGGPDPLAALEGQALEHSRRRGKHLLLDFPQHTLLVHLRLTGQWVPLRNAPRPRLRLRTDAGGVALLDPRRLATLQVLPRGGEAAALPALGEEPWPQRHPGAWWSERLGSARAPLKVALMDQARVAGLGNIAASEICFRAGLAPSRHPATLDAAAWERVADAAWSFLDAVLTEERARGLRYVSAGGLAPAAFVVYGRAGRPCVQCGASVVRAEHAGRGTWWCPACQR